MIKIEFEDHKLSIPENWGDIKLSDYERWFMQNPKTQHEQVQYVADICKLDVSLLLNSPTQLFDIIVNAIRFVFETEFEPCNKINVDGENYFVSFADKLSLGEWVDVEAVLNGESDTKVSELLAILCRPAGESYNSDLMEQRTEVFRSMACDKILPLISFFLLKKKRSDEILSRYSTVIAQVNQFREDINLFAQNGDGIKRLPIWQRIRFYYLMRLLKKRLSKFSDFSSTE